MIIYTDHITDVQEAFNATGLQREGVYLELHGPLGSRKRARRFVVKLSARRGRDRFGKGRRWANSGSWGAATPSNGYVGAPLGEKAATYDEWGLFILELFRRDPDAIIGHYKSESDLERNWARYKEVTATT